METAYDWITVMIFAGLVTRFLSQSAKPDSDDSLWHYLVPSAACAVANWLGNHSHHWAAIAVIAATLWYIAHFLFGLRRRSPPRL